MNNRVFHVDHQIASKNVDDSATEWTRVVQYDEINGYERLSGGKLMSWIDQVAGTVALRHAGTPVTTAAIDNMQFKQSIKLNDIVVVRGHITHVGRTAMEIRVDTYVEDLHTGMRHVVNRAYVTEVCIDEEGKPTTVPYGLNVRTEVERAEWQGAERRIELRAQRRREGF
ncbi:acyl-CoA thioesterase [Butyrivibrio sp. AE3004]|uniref:acyl-CoA thioesterase n=1 Tax=Butyrivibrio sp. AE3004 TaxID=1506994 RepID=UPI000690D5FF|nr:acyl-CoA thioesterase [Butyrivibrio sp. AE3004]